MTDLHLPWLAFMIATPLCAALLVVRARDPERAWRRSFVGTGITLCLAIGAWIDFATLHVFVAHDPWESAAPSISAGVLAIDELSAPLLALAALLHFSVTLATLRTKIRRTPFAWSLVSLALLLTTFGCRAPWGVIGMLAALAVPPWLELRARGCSARVFLLHMSLSVALLIAGQILVDVGGSTSRLSSLAFGMLIVGVLIRCGVAPFHCWMTDLFESATFGTALLFVTPMAGAYAVMRLVLPDAPEWALQSVALWSLATALYAAGMALVQRDARRLFCYLFLSNSSLALVGLEVATPISLTGGLCVWLSVGLSLAGLGLTLRALEARAGRLSLADYHGLYDHMPNLAVFFLLTGLASIGFPGTIGFVGTELLVEGAVKLDPIVGMIVVLVAALNGIAILFAYFRLFTGTRHTTLVSLRGRWPEKIAVLLLTALILGGGLVPQPGIASRYHAATEILARRDGRLARRPEQLGRPSARRPSRRLPISPPAAGRLRPRVTS